MEQKKIGILTFHYGYNYGGVLQSYALQQAILKLGYTDVSIINCIPRKWYWFLIGIPLKLSYDSFYKLWLKIRYGYCCRKAFDGFRQEYLKCTDIVCEKDLYSVANDFDVIISGSDQIWNPSQHSHKIYFLNWFPSFKGKRIAYAPCCTKNIVDKENLFSLQGALQKYDYVSVRNLETQCFIKDLINEDALIVPDPTILIDFTSFIQEQKKFDFPYILTYILGEDIQGGNCAAIDKIRKKYKNHRVISIVIAESNPVNCFWADIILYDVTPIEWLNLIAHASLLYTDSFHGLIFSLKFRTPFFAYYASELRKSRFIDLQERYHIKNNIVISVDQLETVMELEDFTLDFKHLADKMKDQMNIGLSFLRDTIASI